MLLDSFLDFIASKQTCSLDSFRLATFYLPTYGVLVASGVLLGLWISVRNSEKQGINGDDAWNLGIFMVLAGIVGAKILYIVNDWSSYAHNWRDIFSLNTLQAGGVFSGGLIAALAMGAWYMRRHHMPPLRTMDAFAPGLAFGHVLGRFGCFSAGCCYGKPTNHFWGVTFTNPLANLGEPDTAWRKARTDTTDRSHRRILQLPLSDVAAEAQEV